MRYRIDRVAAFRIKCDVLFGIAKIARVQPLVV